MGREDLDLKTKGLEKEPYCPDCWPRKEGAATPAGGCHSGNRICVEQVRNLPANAGDERDAGLIPGLGRSPGEGNSNPLQCSYLENFMDRGAWWATVPRGHKESDKTKRLTLSLGQKRCSPVTHLTMLGLPVSAVGVGQVAVLVPPATVMRQGTVAEGDVIVSVKGCKLPSVVVTERVPCGQR